MAGLTVHALFFHVEDGEI